MLLQEKQKLKVNQNPGIIFQNHTCFHERYTDMRRFRIDRNKNFKNYFLCMDTFATHVKLLCAKAEVLNLRNF